MEKDDIDSLTPPELVSLDEPPADKQEAIEFLLDLIVDAGRVEDREAALEALMKRESQTTTGVGMGIGIPHAKTSAVTRPSVAFARSTEGIEWESMDDKPAMLLFMLLVPEEGGEEHLEILSSLSRALIHEETREKLLEANTKAEVRATLKEAVA
jgi:PTS system fructose-specific IIA component